MKHLGDAELEIMEVLWDADEPVTSSYVSEHLKIRSTWPISTVMTVLSNLAAKGFVYCDRTTRRNLYTAIVDEKAYKNSETKALVSKLFNNSMSAMISNWAEEEGFSKEDMAQLKSIIEKSGADK
jgi:BlaI family penicillinase repressor